MKIFKEKKRKPCKYVNLTGNVYEKITFECDGKM